MTLSFIHSIQSEWLKKRRSLASWVVIVGGFFTPVIITIARLVNHDKLAVMYASEDFWYTLWRTSWESMAIFLLPVGVILATSLITQLEHKNNTWKQLHTVPLSMTTIFLSKFAVIIFMFLQFLMLFNVCIWLSAVIPWLLISNVYYPTAAIPISKFLTENGYYIIDCLPIIAFQYLLGLKYRNFLVPVGTGFLLWIGSLGMLTSKYGYILPYTYGMYDYLKEVKQTRAIQPTVDIHYMALGYFVLFMVTGYFLYITKKDKG